MLWCDEGGFADRVIGRTLRQEDVEIMQLPLP